MYNCLKVFTSLEYCIIIRSARSSFVPIWCCYLCFLSCSRACPCSAYPTSPGWRSSPSTWRRRATAPGSTRSSRSANKCPDWRLKRYCVIQKHQAHFQHRLGTYLWLLTVPFNQCYRFAFIGSVYGSGSSISSKKKYFFHLDPSSSDSPTAYRFLTAGRMLNFSSS